MIFRPVKNIISSPGYFLKEYWQFFSHRHFLKSLDYSKYSFLNGEETLEYLLKNRKSFIRLGEGEYHLLYGFDIDLYPQKYSPGLRDSLLEIIERYDEKSPYLLAIPTMPVQKLSYAGMKKERQLSFWYKTEAFMRKRLKQGCVYGDPLIFKRVLNSNIKTFKLWQDKTVLLVGSMVKYFKDNQLKLTKGQFFLEAPSTNAFNNLDRILKDVIKIARSKNSEDLLILVSLGPAAKPLVYELSKRGLIAYDMGGFFDARYKNAFVQKNK